MELDPPKRSKKPNFSDLETTVLLEEIAFEYTTLIAKFQTSVTIAKTEAGAGLMNTVISYASGKPSDPLRGYSYVHDSNLRQPNQISATMHKMLLVTTVIAYDRLYLTLTGNHPGFPLTSATNWHQMNLQSHSEKYLLNKTAKRSLFALMNNNSNVKEII